MKERLDISIGNTLKTIEKTLFEKCVSVKYFCEQSRGIVVGLSGGPDSVCLLFALKHIADSLMKSEKSCGEETSGFRIIAAHLNHGLRGAEAARDEEFCRSLCTRLGVEFCSKHVDVQEMVNKLGRSCEECGRLARYEFFADICREYGIFAVATGHNREDNAETVFMNLLRGTGADGLCGIGYRRKLCEWDDSRSLACTSDSKEKMSGVQLLRPLLDLSRTDIVEVCEYFDLQPVIDSSNLGTEYRRNVVRLQIFPEIERKLNINISEQVNKLLRLMTVDEDYMEESAQEAYNRTLRNQKGSQESQESQGSSEVVLDTKCLLALHPAIAARVVRKAYNAVSHSMVDFGAVHVEAILKLCRSGLTGKRLCLPHAVEAEYAYEKLCFRTINEAGAASEADVEFGEHELRVGESEKFTFCGAEVCVRTRLIDVCSEENVGRFAPLRERPMVMYFDYDRLYGEAEREVPVFRVRRSGDRIAPLVGIGSKKFKDYLIDLKIPREERGCILLLALGECVVWAVGLTPGREFVPSLTTKRVLEVVVEKTEKMEMME